MDSIRNALIKKSHALTVAAFALFALLGAAPSTAFAVTTLRQVQVSNGTQVDLLFDAKVAKGQIHTEFFNDIIQVSLDETAVYPAKISTVNGQSLLKVFAYQYAPKLVRCRLTVKGKAEDYKDRVTVSPSANGKLLTVRIAGADGVASSDPLSLGAAQANRVVPGSAGDSSPAAKGAVAATAKSAPAPAAKNPAEAAKPVAPDPEEAALLQRVMSGQPAPELAAPVAKKAAAPQPDKTQDKIQTSAAAPTAVAGAPTQPLAQAVAAEDSREKERRTPAFGAAGAKGASKSIAGGKALPSPVGVVLKLALVLGLFGICAVIVRHFKGGSREAGLGALGGADTKGLLGQISKAARGGLAKGGKEKLIEVMSTHYLGPKKSIAVVRVMSRVLVLAVANDSISLITQLEGGSDPLAGLDDLGLGALGGIDLGEQLGIQPAPGAAKTARPQMGAGATAAGPAAFADVLRNERSRPMPAAHASMSTGAGATAAGRPVPAMPGRTPVAYGNAQAPSAPAPSAAQSAINPNTIRDQIRNRLEGLKQL